MKANELRIGNYVLFGNSIEKIFAIGLDKEDGDWLETISEENEPFTKDVGDYKPIPLTEEWLIKFGFEKYGKLLTLAINEDVKLIYCPSNTDMICNIVNNEDGLDHNGNDVFQETNLCIINSKYVHQLQNLYFALIGEELEIK